MKKFFAVFILSTLIFAFGCGNKENDATKDTQQKVEQPTNKADDTNAKVEQKDNTSKTSRTVSIDEINKFASICVDSFITLSNRLTDIENECKNTDINKTKIDRFVKEGRYELDSLSNRVANRIQELKEKAKSGNVSKSEMDKFITETRDEIDSLSLIIAKFEQEIE